MGYYNQPAGNTIPDALSPFEQALRNLPAEKWQGSLDVMETLYRNIAQNPKEEKFRKIKLDNKKISEAITEVDEALEAFLVSGWELSEDSNVLTLPQSYEVSFPSHVNKILEAKQFHRKQLENERAAKGLSRVPPKGMQQKSWFAFKNRWWEEWAGNRQAESLALLRANQQDSYKMQNPDSVLNKTQTTVKPTIANGVITKPVVWGSGVTNGGVGVAPAPTSPSPTDGTSGGFKKKNFNEHAQKAAAQQAEADDLKALQRAKFAQFKADPNARNGEAYQKPASLAAGAKEEEAVWYNPLTWFGGGSSSSSGGGASGPARPTNNNFRDRKPNIRTVGDLPKPVQRGWGPRGC